MDEEDTAGYREPCAQCAAVDWGISDEGRFYCRSCHNVIERTREVAETTFVRGSTRITTLGRGPRTKRWERGRTWMVCEGFQFILKNQADALLRLGVAPGFKDDVLSQLWRLYLQKSRQAYTSDPVTQGRMKGQSVDWDSDSAAESSIMSASVTDAESNPPSTAGSNAENASDWSGSRSSATYRTARQRCSRSLMTMPRTLALIHLALVWSREALTLSDLLRLVKDGHLPYVNAHEQLPEEMKLSGNEALLFHVESVPSHRTVHKEAQLLVLFLQRPAFPPIGPQTLLHPALLSLRYLVDANLPDELHRWVCGLMDRAGLTEQSLTVGPESDVVLPQYDILTAALIVVTMKVLFGLDDSTEWDLSNKVSSQDAAGERFNLRRWYRLMQAALMRAQQEAGREVARTRWKAKKPIFQTRRQKYVVMKKKRTAEQVQTCFGKLSSCPAEVPGVGPSSFRFCWGDEAGADGPSLHHMTLDGVVTLKHAGLTPSNCSYWHPALRPCRSRLCASHFSDVERTLPRCFVWLLQLFSFMLEVKPGRLYEEVLRVERRVFGTKTPLGGASKRRRRKMSSREEQNFSQEASEKPRNEPPTRRRR
ncbi:TATA box-binding protein-associated factor RNA polymerase I subunit B [Odontesthes bonariensis]|uniref:TATA box-binding protein-associated factor RNA polymerase I subunit B n=1 Tax=Odontesthes bonariensis TaxID=219752 RepID=UPI003F588207